MTVRPVAPRVGSLVLLHLTLAVLSLVIEALSVGQASGESLALRFMVPAKERAPPSLGDGPRVSNLALGKPAFMSPSRSTVWAGSHYGQARRREVPGGFAAAESLDGGKRQAFERTSLVTDGIREAYFEEQGSYALVRGDPSPWLVVDLQGQQSLRSVEVWTPMRACDRRLRKLKSAEKAAAQALLDRGQPPPGACKGSSPEMSPTATNPLRVEVFSAEDRLMKNASVVWEATQQASVYSFSLEAEGGLIRVSAPGSGGSLSVSEVQVWGMEEQQQGVAVTGPRSGRGYLGEDRATNPLATSVYLPTAVHHGWWDAKLHAEFQDNMEAFQRADSAAPFLLGTSGGWSGAGGGSCGSAAGYPVLPGPGGAGAGLGSSLYFLAGQMTPAYEARRPFVYIGYLNYAMNERCRAAGAWGLLSCYFVPPSPQGTDSSRAVRGQGLISTIVNLSRRRDQPMVIGHRLHWGGHTRADEKSRNFQRRLSNQQDRRIVQLREDNVPLDDANRALNKRVEHLKSDKSHRLICKSRQRALVPICLLQLCGCMEAEEAMRKSYSHADPNVNSRLASSREPTSRLQLGEEEEVGWTRKGSRGMRRGRGAISKGRGIRSRGGSRASTKKQQDCIVPDSAGRPGGGCGDMSNMTALPSGGGLGAAGILMWRSLQVAHLLRPNKQLEAEMDLERTAARIGYRHPIIGLHMRGGDGCRYGIRARQFRCRTLADYVPQLRTMAMKYGVSRVFLATDEPAALEEAQEFPEFEWVTVPMDRSPLMSATKIEHRLQDDSPQGLGGSGKHEMMVATMRELYLLGAVDFFVGHLASAFSRLALNLNIVNHQRVPPYISLDGPWCPHWRMCCDVDTETGDSRVC